MNSFIFLFWVSAMVLVYVYFGYPMIIFILSQLWYKHPRYSDENLPPVSFVIPAYNEAEVIADKINNTLSLKYPKDKLEIIVVSDGSTDGTDEIVRRFKNKGVQLIRIDSRQGKTHALNVAIPQTKNDIVVLCDANAMYQPNSLIQLMRYFVDEQVGAVTGDVQILNEGEEFGRSEQIYYKIERSLQLWESRFASVIGVDGAMYALRKSLFIPPTDDIILDDFVISMNVIRQGYRVIYNPLAKAYENATPTVAQEINRKARIVAGGLQAFLKKQGLPRCSQWKEWWMYLSHKWLRWLTPIFLLLAFISSALLMNQGMFWWAIFGVQMIFYGLAALGWLRPRSAMPLAIKLPFYFSMINLAALMGIWLGMTGQQKVTWKKAERYRVTVPSDK